MALPNWKQIHIQNSVPKNGVGEWFGVSKNFHDDIWIASLENKLRNSRDDVVISDCRFPNEIRAIKQAGGMVVRVVRGPEPEWYNAAVSRNRGPNGNSTWSLSGRKLEQLGVHASETAWVGTQFDVILDNIDHCANKAIPNIAIKDEKNTANSFCCTPQMKKNKIIAEKRIKPLIIFRVINNLPFCKWNFILAFKVNLFTK